MPNIFLMQFFLFWLFSQSGSYRFVFKQPAIMKQQTYMQMLILLMYAASTVSTVSVSWQSASRALELDYDTEAADAVMRSQRTQLCSLPEKAMAPHSSTLAWKIPWTEEPGGLQSMRLQRLGHDWSDLAAAAAATPYTGATSARLVWPKKATQY